MLHHVSVGVADVERAAKFYDAVLGTLGYKRVMEFLPHAVAYGESAPAFWIGLPHDQQAPSSGNGAHVSFIARSKAAVDDFFCAALEYGAANNGAPGPRADYGPDYYGAFVIDPDGNKIEATLVAAAAKPARRKIAKKATKKAVRKVAKKSAGAAARKKAVKTAKKAKRPAKRAKKARRR